MSHIPVIPLRNGFAETLQAINTPGTPEYEYVNRVEPGTVTRVEVSTKPAEKPATLPDCPYCHSCTVGPRQITHIGGCMNFVIACRLCGAQGPSHETEAGARNLWTGWCGSLAAKDRETAALHLMAENRDERIRDLEKVEHKLDSLRNQRDKAEMERAELQSEVSALRGGHAAQAKVISDLHESLALGRDAIDRLTKELGAKTKGAPPDLVDALRHYLTTCGDVHPRNIFPEHFAKYLMQAGMKVSPTDPSRLIAALEAAMPLLGTQKDAQAKRSTSVELVYREPLTTSQLLRKQADELEDEDAIVTELRAALHDYLSGEKPCEV